VAKSFEAKMVDPGQLHRKSSQPMDVSKRGREGNSKFLSLVHGDLWHNNLFWHGKSFVVADWQLCHVASATNDLCFLLFSSTTPTFRRTNWDSTLDLYYDSFTATLRSLNVDETLLDVNYDEFRAAVSASVPISLFFCGNVQVCGRTDLSISYW
jgi:hypothetical protein